MWRITIWYDGTGLHGSTSYIVNIPIYNNKQGIPISWHVDLKIKPGHVVYCGRLDNNMGCGRGYFAAYTDPRYEGDNAMFKGKIITPNGINLLGNNGTDI